MFYTEAPNSSPCSIHSFRIRYHSPRRNYSHLAEEMVAHVFPPALHTLDVTCGGDIHSPATTRHAGELLVAFVR